LSICQPRYLRYAAAITSQTAACFQPSSGEELGVWRRAGGIDDTVRRHFGDIARRLAAAWRIGGLNWRVKRAFYILPPAYIACYATWHASISCNEPYAATLLLLFWQHRSAALASLACCCRAGAPANAASRTGIKGGAVSSLSLSSGRHISASRQHRIFGGKRSAHRAPAPQRSAYGAQHSERSMARQNASRLPAPAFLHAAAIGSAYVFGRRAGVRNGGALKRAGWAAAMSGTAAAASSA